MSDDNEKLIEKAVAQALSQSDEQNHEDLCHCGLWPDSCVTFGDRKPWSHDAESVARAAAMAVFEKAHTPTDAPTPTASALQVEGDPPSRVAPTDDEREALLDAVAENYRPGYTDSAHDRDYWEAMAYKDGYHDGSRRSEVPEPSAEDERIEAWHYVADHEAFKACYDEEQPLIDSVLARITQLHELETTVNELAPAPTLPLEPSDAHELDRVGICQRCGQGITASELLDGQRCAAVTAQVEPSDPRDSDLIAWHVEQIELLRPFRRSSAHLKAAMMHAATVRALRAASAVAEQGENRDA